jgi:hypothetical protein
MSENKVVHFPNENEFRLRLTPINEKKVEHFAILQYQEIKPGVFDLFHTEGNTGNLFKLSMKYKILMYCNVCNKN